MTVIKPGSELASTEFSEGIKEIHASINWSRYDGFLRQKDTLVAMVDNKIAGYAVTTFGSSSYIFFIAVNKECQNRKIGQALMKEIVKNCNEIGTKTLSLHFRASNETTARFYENFVKTNQIKYEFIADGFYGETDPRTYLTMTLKE